MACKSMSWDDMLHVLDSCYDFCNRVGRQPYFYITGGDPILHRDFWRLAEELHARGAKWCIMGNPFHLTDEVCARMHALGCRKYQLSLDGAAHRRRVRVPPHGKPHRQRTREKHVRPVHGAEYGSAPRVLEVREVQPLQAARVLSRLSGRGGGLHGQQVRP